MFDPGSILVVCTANVCRSPLAAETLEQGLAGSGRLAAAHVSSAGTRADDGSGMCAVSATLLPAGDPVPREHRSRHLTPELVRAADLVLTMEREQRSAVSRLAPGSQAKVFTLKEALELARTARARGADPAPASVAEVARALHAVRGYATPQPVEQPRRRFFARRPPEPVDPLTIPDGHGFAEPVHRAAVEDVRATTRELADALRALTD